MTATRNGSTLTAARAYLAAGLSILPVRLDGSKTPALSAWKRLTAELPLSDEVDEWFANNAAGIGVINGKVSGNLECIDFDKEAKIIFPAWCELVEVEAPGLIPRLSVARTPKPGYHVRYRVSGEPVPGNDKLAMTVEGDCLVETRGEAGYAIAPGSPAACHATGREYVHHSGPRLSRVKTITAAERDLLIRAARSFDRSPPVEEPRGGPRPVEGLSPGDDFSARGPDWADLLTPHDWDQVHQRGDVRYWRRPGKDGRGWSATTGACRSQAGVELFAVFSTAAVPFPGPGGGRQCSTHSRFSVYALLNHAGDFSAAAKALAEQGYGDPACPRAPAALVRPFAPTITNYLTEHYIDADGKQQTRKRFHAAGVVVKQIAAVAPGWPKSVDSQLFAEDRGRPLWLNSPTRLFAWAARCCDPGSDNPIDWNDKSTGSVSRGEFFAHLQQTAERYEAVEFHPHYPPLAGHYYMHPEVKGGDGQALRELLERFEPETPVDHDLIEAFILTLLWGGRPGSRPAFLFTTSGESDGRGAGKSTVPKMGGELTGGLILASDKEEMPKLITRLLTPSAYEQRVVLLDNVKSLKFSWAELEALITSDTISGHRMYMGDGRRPNMMTYTITVNGASMSRDMAQRCVVVMVKRPKYSAAWEEKTRNLIETNRWEIIGDCLAILKRRAPTLARFSRWASWEAGVLAHVAEASECQRVIAERQAEIDEDAGEASIVREAFIEELKSRGHDAETAAVLIPSADAAEIVNRANGEKRPTNRANAYLRTLDIPELRKSDRKGVRGFAWRGERSHKTATCLPLNQKPAF